MELDSCRRRLDFGAIDISTETAPTVDSDDAPPPLQDTSEESSQDIDDEEDEDNELQRTLADLDELLEQQEQRASTYYHPPRPYHDSMPLAHSRPPLQERRTAPAPMRPMRRSDCAVLPGAWRRNQTAIFTMLEQVKIPSTLLYEDFTYRESHDDDMMLFPSATTTRSYDDGDEQDAANYRVPNLMGLLGDADSYFCLLYTSPSPRD